VKHANKHSIQGAYEQHRDIQSCGSCFSMDVYPYMGFETGQQYECKACGMISSLVVEFETMEALQAFRKAIE